MGVLSYEGDGWNAPQGYAVLCGLDLCDEGNIPNSCTWWRLGRGLHDGMRLVWVEGAWLQEQVLGGQIVCTDGYGRRYDDCTRLYSHPEGPSAPYTNGGYPYPGAKFCGAPTPTPTPGATPTPFPTPPNGDACAPVEAINHFIAGGGGCHAWHPISGGRVRCVLDSTVRPICDEDHMQNWTTFCGYRTHDPDYASDAGAQLWTIRGAEDWGVNHYTDPNTGKDVTNSAQRIIAGPEGGEVQIEVCLRPDARTYDGCPIPLTNDPCARSKWNLPRSGDQ